MTRTHGGPPAKPLCGIVAVPARRSSRRLPNKLLLAHTGRPLLAYTLEQALLAKKISQGRITEVLLACDHEDLMAVADSRVRSVLTTGEHRCGTTRIAEAITTSARPNLDFIVDLQADQPDIDPRAIVAAIDRLTERPDVEMATLAVAHTTRAVNRWHDRHVVKVVLNASDIAIYFSRSAVPFVAQPELPLEHSWYEHIGVYAFRPSALELYSKLPPSRLELREDLEQLRAVEAGIRIGVSVISPDWAGTKIDTMTEYEQFVLNTRRPAATDAMRRRVSGHGELSMES